MVGEQYLDTSIRHELDKPTIDLCQLEVGSELDLVLAEGDDGERQAHLRLQFISPPKGNEPGKFKVVDGVIDDEVVRRNAKAEMPVPEKMGGEIWVNFACTYRRGCMPPITMGQNDAISPGRHLFMWIPAPSPESPARGIRYHAEVLSAQVVEQNPAPSS